MQNNYTFQTIVDTKNADDHHLYAESIDTWNNRHNGIPFENNSSLHYNQIIRVDFGIACVPEMGFRHPALLMKYENQFCKVLPITSSIKKVNGAYHPIIRPNGNKAYYLLPKGTCALPKESCVLLRQSRTISESRIRTIEDPVGLSEETYKEIRKMAFRYDFPEMYSQLMGAEKEKATKQAQLNILENIWIPTTSSSSMAEDIAWRIPDDYSISNHEPIDVEGERGELVTVCDTINNVSIKIAFLHNQVIESKRIMMPPSE